MYNFEFKIQIMNTVSKCKAYMAMFTALIAASSTASASSDESKSEIASLRDSAFAAATSGDADQASLIIAENIVVSFTDGAKYYIFSPQEKILSDFIRYRFKTILTDCRAGINETVGYINKADDKVHNYYLDADDSLDYAMMDLSIQHAGLILGEIEKSTNLTDEEKQFLKIKLDYTSNFGRFCNIEADDFTLRGREFLSTSKDSVLADYTEQMLYVPKRINLNAASNIFAGVFVPTGSIANKLSNGAILGLSLDFGYDRARLMADFGFLTAIKVKEDFNVNSTLWEKDAKASGSFVTLGAGFNISPFERLNIIPTVAIHTSSLRNSDSPALGQGDAPANISSGIRPMAGLAIDYNIALPYCDGEILGDTERRMIFVRAKAMYVPSPYGGSKSNYSGDAVVAGFGIGLYTDQRK